MTIHNDLTGKRFGKLVAIEYIPGTKTTKSRWVCKCDCGRVHSVATNNLTRGMAKSCGQCSRRIYDYTGMRFGKLIVLNPDVNEKNRIGWKCRCDCGNEVFIETGRLTSALKYPDSTKCSVTSCGCIAGEHIIHGGSYTRLYRVWTHMKQRCYNEKSNVFKYYGGRGIKICDEWKDNFSAFQKWAIDNGYDEEAEWFNCTIDRIDVNGDYEPSNCRWADMHTQLLNRRAARLS